MSGDHGHGASAVHEQKHEVKRHGEKQEVGKPHSHEHVKRWTTLSGITLFLGALIAIIFLGKDMGDRDSEDDAVSAPASASASASPAFPTPQLSISNRWTVEEFTVPPKGESEWKTRPKNAKYYWNDPSGDLLMEVKFQDGTSTEKPVPSWERYQKKIQSWKFINPHDGPVKVKLLAQT